MTNIIVEPRFRDKIPKPTPEEFRQMEENIVSEGKIRDPLVVWAGKNILLDGHNRWAIYQKHQDVLPFPTIEELPFDDECAAEDWVLFNQLGRRNLSPEQCSVLRAQVYRTMRKAHGGDRRSEEFSSDQNGHLKGNSERTAEKAAERLGVGRTTIIRDEQFLRGLEAAEEVAPGFKDEVLTGETKAKKAEVAELRNKEPEDRLQAIEEIRSPKPKVTFPSGNKDWKTKPTAEEEEIAKRDERVTNRHAKVEYTVEDLVEELTAIQNDFFQKYLLALDIHRDVALDTAKGRREVLGCIKEFEKKFNIEVKEIFK